MNSGKIRLSVIIPVYNTARFLPACLESVLAQSPEMEILVIDDGSTDDSWAIIQQYADKHASIKTFRQQRRRQGAARNLGLAHAVGDYISFVDSDDLLPDNALQYMLEIAEQYSCDMVIGPYESFYRNRQWFELPIHSQLLTCKTGCTDIFSMPELLEDISVCNKMVKAQVIRENRLRFPPRYAGEDVIFTSQLYLSCRSIGICQHVVYRCRRKRKTASSFRINTLFFENRKSTALAMEEVFSAHDATAIYPYLIKSEVRKLVGSRLARVVRELPDREQRQVFQILRKMTTMIDPKNVYHPRGYFNAAHRISIRLLQENETTALQCFERSLTKTGFITKIDNKKLRRELAGQVPHLYLLGIQRLLSRMF